MLGLLWMLRRLGPLSNGTTHLVGRFFGFAVASRPIRRSLRHGPRDHLLVRRGGSMGAVCLVLIGDTPSLSLARVESMRLTSPTGRYLAAALLHDVGKVDSALWARRPVWWLPSLVMVGGHRASVQRTGRIGRYLRHPSHRGGFAGREQEVSRSHCGVGGRASPFGAAMLDGGSGGRLESYTPPTTTDKRGYFDPPGSPDGWISVTAGRGWFAPGPTWPRPPTVPCPHPERAAGWSRPGRRPVPGSDPARAVGG